MFKTKLSKRSINTTIFINAIVVMTFYCITNTFTGLFDGFVVSHYLGDLGSSAIRLVKTLNQLITCIAQLFGLGCQIIATKHMAQGNKEKANQVFNMVFFFTLFLSIGLTVLNLSISRYMPYILSGGKATDPKVLEYCSYYVFSYSLGIPFLILGQILNPIVYLDGDHKLSKITIAVSIVVNCTCTFLAAKFANNKIFYIGLASSLACFSTFVVYMFHFFSKKYTFKLKFQKVIFSEFKEVLKHGSTMALKLLAITVKLYLFTIIIFSVGNKSGTGQGDIINAARGAQETISGFFETPLGGLLLTIIMMNGVYYSEQDDDGFKHLIKTVVKFYFIACVTIAIGYFFAARALAVAYLPKDSKSLELCVYGMRCGAVTILFLPFNTTVLGTFQSCRKIVRAYVTTMIQSFVLPVSCMAIFGFAFGPYGIFTGYLINTMLFLPIFLITTCIVNKGWPKTIKKFFMIDKSFGFKEKCKINADIHNINDITKLNENIIHFCKVNKINNQTRDVLLACSDKLIDLVCHKYYTKNKKAVMINVRVTYSKGQITYRIMDNLKIHSLSELHYSSRNKVNKDVSFFKKCGAEFNHSNVLKMNYLSLKMNKDNDISETQLNKIRATIEQANNA